MKIVVVGGGSTGLVYGSMLSRVTDTIILVRRKEAEAAINSEGVTFDLFEGGQKHFSPSATTDTSVLNNADFVLSMTKCLHAREVGSVLAQNIGKNTTVLPLHNGLGTQDIYNDALGAQRVIAGTQYLISNRTADNRLKIGKNVRTVIGEQDSPTTNRIETLLTILLEGGFDATGSNDIWEPIWAKFHIAVCQHALSALHDMTFGDMNKSDDVKSHARLLSKEFNDIAQAEGIKFSNREDPFDEVLENMQRGGLHKSSMCQDLLAHRNTEIDFINGEIVRRGKIFGIDTSENEKIVNEIKLREQNHK